MGGSRHWIVNTKSVPVKCHSMIWEVVFEKSAARQTSRKLEREERREGRKGGKWEGRWGKRGKRIGLENRVTVGKRKREGEREGST